MAIKPALNMVLSVQTANIPRRDISACIEYGVGPVQNDAGHLTCEACPPDTYSDQSRVCCLPWPYRLGSYNTSVKGSFCLMISI